MGVDCVFSAAPVPPRTRAAACAADPAEAGARLNCNGGLGSATFVTGVFGFALAGWMVNRLAGTAA